MTSTAFDRLANPTEAALYDADPATYRHPEWLVEFRPWEMT